MASRTLEVLKNKNKLDRARRKRRTEEMIALKEETAYKAALKENLKYVEMLLSDPEVHEVVIEVPNDMLPRFGAAVYGTEMAEYVVKQMDGSPNKYAISHKLI